MLFGAMDVLSLGDPWDLATDVGPVIDAEAQAGIAEYVAKARAEGRPSVPSRLSGERATNPFLRASRPEMKAALGMEGESDAAVFAELRARKDRF